MCVFCPGSAESNTPERANKYQYCAGLLVTVGRTYVHVLVHFTVLQFRLLDHIHIQQFHVYDYLKYCFALLVR